MSKALHMTKEQAEAHQRKHGFDFPMAKNTDAAGYPVFRPNRSPKKMNKTEREYSIILEAMKRRGEILRWEFEGITLRWGGLRYTPDFVVFAQDKYLNGTITTIKLIEVKGAHIWDDAMVKFKAARAHWPEFAFEMHQKTKGQWSQIL